MTQLTTIKVPTGVRERVALRAAEERVTAAEVITRLLDDDDRRRRFDAVRSAYAEVDPTYVAETADWGALDGEALDGEALDPEAQPS